MTLTWLEHSEIAFGLILNGKLSLTTVRPEQFHIPYNDGVKLLKDGVAKEDIISAIGLDAYQAAVEAANTINGASNLSWAEMLEKSFIYYDAGARLEKFSKKLQKGEDIDWSEITYIANKAQTNISSGYIPITKIEGGEVSFIETGWQVFDEHIGGFPEVGLVIIGGNAGSGKAQPLYSKILTPFGWKTMGDIKVGDYIIGSNGNSYSVLNIYPQGIRPIYRVWFDDDTYTDCDEEHLWTVYNQANRKSKIPQVKTLKELINNGLLSEYDGRKNYSIDIVKPINFLRRNLLLDPYLMGILLAEGTFSKYSIKISSIDEEILNKIRKLLPETDELIFADRCNYRIAKKPINGTRNHKKTKLKTLDAIKFYGLDRHKSNTKFIPYDYLFSSIEDRLELLRGLADGDGSFAKGNIIEYSTSSSQLKDDFCNLCRSLGAKVRWKTRMGRYVNKGRVIQTSLCYRITASFPNNINPFYMSRKANKFEGKKRWHQKFIKKVEYIGEFDAQCIYVDSPDHTYITDNYIVTHNTYSMTKLAASFVKMHPTKKVALNELEQEAKEIRARINETENISEKELERIIIDDNPTRTIEQIISKCATIENLGLVMIDYVDYLVHGETTEPVMSGIYRTAVLGSKQLHCPIVLYAQLTGYESGIPKPRHIRWTRLAHGLTWMLCMVYNPATDEHDFSTNEDEYLPATPNTAYMIVWKVKGGFRKHLEDSPGAIAIPFRGDKGWHNTKGRWFSLKKS